MKIQGPLEASFNGNPWGNRREELGGEGTVRLLPSLLATI